MGCFFVIVALITFAQVRLKSGFNGMAYDLMIDENPISNGLTGLIFLNVAMVFLSISNLWHTRWFRVVAVLVFLSLPVASFMLFMCCARNVV